MNIGDSVFVAGKVTGLAGSQAILTLADGSVAAVPQADVLSAPSNPVADALASIKADTAQLVAGLTAAASSGETAFAGVFGTQHPSGPLPPSPSAIEVAAGLKAGS